MDANRHLTPISKLWLDDVPTDFTHAFVERFAYEWVVEIVNPFPIPLIENREYVLTLSFEQKDGVLFPSINIESYDIMQGDEFTVYRFYMYPL
ncbi:hypothetical protein [Salimicrobium halophilum]|uniref:Uncharacterized protein n=1 Tax=Salimicrobium halophilum TaxID=86666 RepID=A0A1G8S2I1_9BACI|nr:hypothetical protein [Salimicrobium halophilum]SDJ23403.1 hypothetical protein SAMN04490247_1217 [Salimicrobium halophilum]